MSSRSWVRCFVSTTFLCTSIKYQATHGKCGCVFSLEGNTYNISSLISKHGASFHAKDHWGWNCSFNPCVSFTMGSSKNGDCQSDVAICRWVFNQTYKKIGSQSSEECRYNKIMKAPKLQYSSDKWKAGVLLKCDPNERKGIFKVQKDGHSDDFVFTLTHQCACANSCLSSPSMHTTTEPRPRTTTDPCDPSVVYIEAAAGVIGVAVFIGVLIFAVRYFLKKRNENNDNGERRHLVPNDQQADLIHNRIEELNRANRSRPLPIGSSHAKADFNVLRSAHS